MATYIVLRHPIAIVVTACTKTDKFDKYTIVDAIITIFDGAEGASSFLTCLVF